MGFSEQPCLLLPVVFQTIKKQRIFNGNGGLLGKQT